MKACLIALPAIVLIGYELEAYYSEGTEDPHEIQQSAAEYSLKPEVADARYEELLDKLAQSDRKLADLTKRLEHLTREMALAQEDIAKRQQQVARQEARGGRHAVVIESTSVQSRFQYPAEADLATDSYLDTEQDIMDAVASNMLQSGEILSSECRTGLCKIYHSNHPTDFSNDDFASNLATSLGGEVSLYFDQENGQSVVYVEMPGSR